MAACGLALLAPTALAQTKVIAYAVPAGTAGNQAFGGTLGMDFDVYNPIVITRLGVFDDGSDGLNLPITARLYHRGDLTELAAIGFTPEDPGELVGGSRFKVLPEPLRLEIGFQATIVAEGYGTEERLRNASLAPIGPVWTLNDGNGSLKFVGTSRWGDMPWVYPANLDTMVAEYAAGTFEFELLPPLRPGAPVLRVPPPAVPGAITIVWDPVTEPMPAVKYQVYRAATADGPFSLIAEVGATTFHNIGLTDTVPVFYKVVAVGSGGETSLDSNIITPPRAGIAYINPEGQSGNQAFGGSVGMDFDVVFPVYVTQLGVFDSYSDGLFATLHVAIWNRVNQKELVSLEFTPEKPGALVGGSRFLPLNTPLLLPAGFQGTVVAYGYTTEVLFNTENRPEDVARLGLFDGGCLTFVGRSRYGDAGQFPVHVDKGPVNRYAAGTFSFEPVRIDGEDRQLFERLSITKYSPFQVIIKQVFYPPQHGQFSWDWIQWADTPTGPWTSPWTTLPYPPNDSESLTTFPWEWQGDIEMFTLDVYWCPQKFFRLRMPW